MEETFICEECGNTSPIPNEVCPNCGGKMLAAGADFTGSDDENADDDDAGYVEAGPKVVSLEDEREQEERDNYSNLDEDY